MSRIRRMLDLSTAHLPERYADDGPALDDAVNADDVSHGWLMYVPEDPAAYATEYDEDAHEDDYPGVSPEILRIQLHARKLGCDYVLFDRDADQDDDLPTWDW